MKKLHYWLDKDGEPMVSDKHFEGSMIVVWEKNRINAILWNSKEAERFLNSAPTCNVISNMQEEYKRKTNQIIEQWDMPWIDWYDCDVDY